MTRQMKGLPHASAMPDNSGSVPGRDGLHTTAPGRDTSPSDTLLHVSADAESAESEQPLLLKPARVFDGVNPKTHEGWVVLVKGNRIQSAGPAGDVKPPAGPARSNFPA